MTEVIIGGEKHDHTVFATALACIRYRLNQGTYDFDPDEEGRVELAAEILHTGSESRAWHFLLDNSNYEYEEVTRVRVIE